MVIATRRYLESWLCRLRITGFGRLKGGSSNVSITLLKPKTATKQKAKAIPSWLKIKTVRKPIMLCCFTYYPTIKQVIICIIWYCFLFARNTFDHIRNYLNDYQEAIKPNLTFQDCAGIKILERQKDAKIYSKVSNGVVDPCLVCHLSPVRHRGSPPDSE